MKQVQGVFFLCLKSLFGLLVLANVILISYKALSYYPANFSKGFLSDKQPLFENTLYPIFFYGHIAVSTVILLIGLLQLGQKIRKAFTSLHRWLGKVYVLLVLFISAPSAFVMGIYATGHWLIKFGFVAAAILWWVFTFKAYTSIKKQNIERHKLYMQRSYIIALLAVF